MDSDQGSFAIRKYEAVKFAFLMFSIPFVSFISSALDFNSLVRKIDKKSRCIYISSTQSLPQACIDLSLKCMKSSGKWSLFWSYLQSKNCDYLLLRQRSYCRIKNKAWCYKPSQTGKGPFRSNFWINSL